MIAAIMKQIHAENVKTPVSTDCLWNNIVIRPRLMIYGVYYGKLIIAKAIPEKFTPLAQSQIFKEKGLCWTMPILSNGKIYARDEDGGMVCIDMSGSK